MLAADSYDSKWGIDFGRDRSRAGHDEAPEGARTRPGTWDHALEIGAGTGYFSLNLMNAGTIEQADSNRHRAGDAPRPRGECRRPRPRGRDRRDRRRAAAVRRCDVRPRARPRRPPPHPRPRPRRRRVPPRPASPAAPSSSVASPPRYGDQIAAVPKRAAIAAAPLWRRVVGAGQRSDEDGADPDYGHALEGEVDVHAFDPGTIWRIFEHAGFDGVRIRGEELLANLYGWWLRTVESTATPAESPALAPLRVPQLPLAATGRQPAAGAVPAAGALLQPRLLGPQARLRLLARRTPTRARGGGIETARPHPRSPSDSFSRRPAENRNAPSSASSRISRGDEHASRTRRLGDPAGEVDGPPVVVTATGEHGAVGEAGADQRQLVSPPPLPPLRPSARRARERSRAAHWCRPRRTSPRRRSASRAGPGPWRPRAQAPRAGR